MSCWSDSGSSRSLSDVKPLTSANRTVTVLRDCVARCSSPGRRAPQAEQKLASSAAARPHPGHVAMWPSLWRRSGACRGGAPAAPCPGLRRRERDVLRGPLARRREARHLDRADAVHLFGRIPHGAVVGLDVAVPRRVLTAVAARLAGAANDIRRRALRELHGDLATRRVPPSPVEQRSLGRDLRCVLQWQWVVELAVHGALSFVTARQARGRRATATAAPRAARSRGSRRRTARALTRTRRRRRPAPRTTTPARR